MVIAIFISTGALFEKGPGLLKHGNSQTSIEMNFPNPLTFFTRGCIMKQKQGITHAVFLSDL